MYSIAEMSGACQQQHYVKRAGKAGESYLVLRKIGPEKTSWQNSILDAVSIKTGTKLYVRP